MGPFVGSVVDLLPSLLDLETGSEDSGSALEDLPPADAITSGIEAIDRACASLCLIGYDVTGVNVHKDVAMKTLRIELNMIVNDPMIATIYQLVWVPIVEMCCSRRAYIHRRPSAWL